MCSKSRLYFTLLGDDLIRDSIPLEEICAVEIMSEAKSIQGYNGPGLRAAARGDGARGRTVRRARTGGADRHAGRYGPQSGPGWPGRPAGWPAGERGGG